MNVNLLTYTALATRTESVLPPYMGMPQKTSRCLHAALGMQTELAELLGSFRNTPDGEPLDLVHIKEEIGDVFWYVAIACEARGLNFAEWVGEARYEPTDFPLWLTIVAMIHSAEYSDAVKRTIFYGKEPTWDKWDRPLLMLMTMMVQLAYACKLNLVDILEANIAKLAKRYPDKFSADQAVNRDLDAERAALEGKAEPLAGKIGTP
jgi:hypothetical protein